jgi:hypothetical protein
VVYITVRQCGRPCGVDGKSQVKSKLKEQSVLQSGDLLPDCLEKVITNKIL